MSRRRPKADVGCGGGRVKPHPCPGRRPGRPRRPILGYVSPLTERMDATHWRPNDPAYEATWRCRKALEEMTAALTDPHRPLSPPPKPWERGGGEWDKGA